MAGLPSLACLPLPRGNSPNATRSPEGAPPKCRKLPPLKDYKGMDDDNVVLFTASQKAVSVIVPHDDPVLEAAVGLLEETFVVKEFRAHFNCGSYNCFTTTVVDGTVVGEAIKLCLLLTRNNVPKKVGVRTALLGDPNLDPAGADDAWKELTYTLKLAKRGLTPPVLCAFATGHSEDLRQKRYMYIVEAGWSDLELTLKSDLNQTATKSMSQSINSIMEKAADEHFLFFDMRTRNMVAKETGGIYEVRLIDFGPDFTVNANMFVNSSDPSNSLQPISKDCVYVINGVLLLNYVLSHVGANKRRLVFGELANEIRTRWAKVESSAADPLCGLLSKDSQFLGDDVAKYMRKNDETEDWEFQYDGEGLYSNEAPKFFDALRIAFYRMLDAYGNDTRYTGEDTKQASEPSHTSYISSVVELVTNGVLSTG